MDGGRSGAAGKRRERTWCRAGTTSNRAGEMVDRGLLAVVLVVVPVVFCSVDFVLLLFWVFDGASVPVWSLSGRGVFVLEPRGVDMVEN